MNRVSSVHPLEWITAAAGAGVFTLNVLQVIQAWIGIAVGIASFVLTVVLIWKNLRDARKTETQAAGKTAGERKTNVEGNDES